MSIALATREETTAPAVTTEQLDLIRRTLAKDATPDELKLYLYDCARQGVHPLDKLIHFTKRAGKYTPITSIDFMRIRAADSGEMAGSDDPVFDADPTHGTDDPKRVPEFATVTVYRLTQGQRFAYTATARWSEYKPEQNDFMWRRMPRTMLGKCAEALALRKAFPRQLAGLYEKAEIDQAETETTPASRVVPPAVPEKPEGFNDWFDDLQAIAQDGDVALRTAWASSPADFRRYLTLTDKVRWETLKQKAATVRPQGAA